MKMEKSQDYSNMKLAVSSYNKEKPSCTLLDIDITKAQYQIVDEISLCAPSFIISDGTYLFTYSKAPIQLLSYRIENNRFVLVDRLSLPGETLTHLAYSKKHQRLYAASYLDGAYLKVDVKDGFFSNLIYKKQEGTPSKCHCVTLSEDEEKVYITNIAQDRIYVYDSQLQYLTTYVLPTGVGPRHTIIYQDYLYTVTEYSNEVIVLNSSGEMKQRISTTQGYDEPSYGATLFVDDNRLYASNRGLETIAVFEICNHLLEYKKMIPTYGNHSRHMILTKDKHYIISFNKNSHQISCIDKKKEELVLSIPYDQVSCGVEL